MGRQFRKTEVYETHSGDEQTGEYELAVVYDVSGPEPDVGIHHTSVELIDVEVKVTAGMYPLAAKDVRETALNDEAWFDRIRDDLVEHASETVAAELDARDEAKSRD